MGTAAKRSDIVLVRGKSGLGFNICGGLDNPHIPDDPGIFVAEIRPKRAAARDGRLQEGDKILAINGTNVEKVAHGSAVQLFRLAGDTVRLTVQQDDKVKPKLSLDLSNGDSIPSVGKVEVKETGGEWSGLYLTLTTSVIAISLFLGFRYMQKQA